jgi:hypothetical protein
LQYHNYKCTTPFSFQIHAQLLMSAAVTAS